jgi:DNA-binding XRE family transcriptional regulator
MPVAPAEHTLRNATPATPGSTAPQDNHRPPEQIVIIHNFSRLVGFHRTAILNSHEKYMDTKKDKNENGLAIYRRRMGFSQRKVAKLLGHKDASLVCLYEHGQVLPPLRAALGLGIILRVPVEFLFPGLYDSLRNHIRGMEESEHASRPCRT